MTGIEIIGALLTGDAAVMARLPADEQIKAGQLPEDAPVPSLLARTISRVERLTLERERMIRWVDRIRVTVRAANYEDQIAIIRLATNACAGFAGDIAGARNVSITSAGTGPDLIGPGNTFEASQDFRVTYDAPA